MCKFIITWKIGSVLLICADENSLVALQWCNMHGWMRGDAETHSARSLACAYSESLQQPRCLKGFDHETKSMLKALQRCAARPAYSLRIYCDCCCSGFVRWAKAKNSAADILNFWWLESVFMCTNSVKLLCYIERLSLNYVSACWVMYVQVL